MVGLMSQTERVGKIIVWFCRKRRKHDTLTNGKSKND